MEFQFPQLEYLHEKILPENLCLTYWISNAYMQDIY
jgi:hypothetical protein